MRCKHLLIFLLLIYRTGYAQFTLSCDSFCVLNIEMDSLLNGFMNVTIYNANTGQINYPTVQVIDNNTGDTIGNPDGTFDLFTQPGNTTITHKISSAVDSLPEPLNIYVLLTDQIWDTTCELSYPCALPTGISESDHIPFRIFPNPASHEVTIEGSNIEQYSLFNQDSRLILHDNADYESPIKVDISQLSPGIYFLVVAFKKERIIEKIVVIK